MAKYFVIIGLFVGLANCKVFSCEQSMNMIFEITNDSIKTYMYAVERVAKQKSEFIINGLNSVKKYYDAESKLNLSYFAIFYCPEDRRCETSLSYVEHIAIMLNTGITFGVESANSKQRLYDANSFVFEYVATYNGKQWTMFRITRKTDYCDYDVGYHIYSELMYGYDNEVVDSIEKIAAGSLMDVVSEMRELVNKVE